MEEDFNSYRTCLIPIIAFIVAGLIGNLSFWVVEKADNYLAVIIMAAIFIPFLIFIIRCIIGTKK